MKHVLWVLLVVQIAVAVCPCSTQISVDEDRVAGRSIASSKSIVATKDDVNGLVIRMQRNLTSPHSSILLVIVAVGASPCISEGSLINVLFDDDSRLELKTNNKFNCDGRAVVYLGLTSERLNTLCDKKIKTLRVWTHKSYVQEDLTDEQAQLIASSLDCLRRHSQ